MTANRYKRATTQRALTEHGARIPPVEFGNPRPTFRAAITDLFDDITLERRDYFATTSDTVFWDYWDDNYNRHIFEPTFQPSGIDAGRVAAVELLIPGLYAIRATIDWQTAAFDLGGAFNSWIGSNYDDGGLEHDWRDLSSTPLGGWVLNQFRVVWPSFTGSESSVEITATHDNAAEEPLYIPGGFAGYWAEPPMFTIAYLGGLEGDPEFFADV